MSRRLGAQGCRQVHRRDPSKNPKACEPCGPPSDLTRNTVAALPCSPLPSFERAVSGAIYRRALVWGAVNSRVFCRVPAVGAE